MKKLLLTISLILITSTATNALTLNWKACEGCETYRLERDGEIFADKLTTTERNVDDLEWTEGTEYTLKVYGQKTAGELTLIGAPCVLKYTHHSEQPPLVQNISTPTGINLTINVGINP